MKKNGVLCAVDVHDYDQQVIDLAASFAKRFGVDLDLIHVTLSPDPTKAAWPAYVGAPDELARGNRLLRQLATSVKGVSIHRHHLSGLPVSKVVDFVKKNEPRLLVLGTHGRQGFHRIVGSSAAQIMRRVSCPVMIYRQRKNSQTFSQLSTTLEA